MHEIVQLILGFVILFIGAEALLRGSVSLATRFHLSKIVIGAVVVGFGTSMPELVVSVNAALKGSSDIALGNVIGSNIANTFLIVGLAALIFPMHIKDKSIRRDIFVMNLAAVLLLVFMSIGFLRFATGVLFLGLLFVYIVWSIQQDRKHRNLTHEHMEEDALPAKPYTKSIAGLLTIVGLGGLIGGSALLVRGAILLAKSYQVPEAVIGLTIVAVGTALPEIAVAVMAALRRHGDVVMGNILGSNVFNILAIVGATCLVRPLTFSAQLLKFDIWVMIGMMVFLSILLLKQVRIGRWIGCIMLAAYAAYTAFLYLYSV